MRMTVIADADTVMFKTLRLLNVFNRPSTQRKQPTHQTCVRSGMLEVHTDQKYT